MRNIIEGIGIKAVSVAVPANVVDVFQYVKCRNESDIQRVVKKTGISSIRMTKEGETTSDLCVKAADAFLSDGYDKENICAVFFVSKTPDHIVLPPTSCLIQARLGLGEEVLCYDSMAACYGYIAGLQLAAMTAKTLGADVLLMTGDTNSKIIHPKDSSAVMFGDGGAASIIGPANGKSIEIHIRNNGRLAEVASVKAGGFRHPVTEESLKLKEDERGNSRSDCHMHMRGLEMMNFVLNDAAKLVGETINEHGGVRAFGLFALHQPNEMIIKSLSTCLGIPMEKIPLCVNGYGNISSASIPLALSKRLYGKDLSSGCKVLMAGYGGGASWGTAVTDVSGTKFYPVTEM